MVFVNISRNKISLQFLPLKSIYFQQFSRGGEMLDLENHCDYTITIHNWNLEPFGVKLLNILQF